MIDFLRRAPGALFRAPASRRCLIDEEHCPLFCLSFAGLRCCTLPGPRRERFPCVASGCRKSRWRNSFVSGHERHTRPVMAGLPGLVRQTKNCASAWFAPTNDGTGRYRCEVRVQQKPGRLIPDPVQRTGVVKAGNNTIIFPDEAAALRNPKATISDPPTSAGRHSLRGAEVYYRVGEVGRKTKPPADFDKYARVVKHIAMHYNQGWDNGFHYNIRYWEFWNEPGTYSGRARRSSFTLCTQRLRWP